jgi:hypothetical protein
VTSSRPPPIQRSGSVSADPARHPCDLVG